MALYDLVTLKKSLTEAVNADPVVEKIVELRNNIAKTKNQVPNLDAEHQAYVDKLIDYYETLIEQAQQPVEEFKSQLKIIDQQIADVVHTLFANNYELEERTGGIDNVRNNRRIYLREDVEQEVKQRILLHTNWRYPALEIGCRDGEWTQYLVSADPLYITDPFQGFLDSTNSKFPEAYQNRLRKYPLVRNDLSQLPRGQFAFVFSWAYFNYVSLDTMTQMLRQIKELLRPGGVFLFSYNNGDTPAGAGMAENFAQSYMPKSILIPVCQSLGFEIVQEFDYEPNISWLEIKRPGELHTIKAHQVLGEIKRR